MNKAKALFAAGMMVVVAGASTTAWYLNDKGIIGVDQPEQYYEEYEQNDKENNDEEYNEKENNDKREDVDNYNENEDPDKIDDANADNNENVTELNRTEDDNNPAEKEPDNKTDNSSSVSNEDINEFLSNFSKVFFAEQGNHFSGNGFPDYELIRFAYSHLMRTERSSVELKQENDDIKYYNVFSYNKINNILDKFFGLSVPPASVYTGNSNAFFKYSDGYFYTPATDGIAYNNNVIVDSVKSDDEHLLVQFTVYSSGTPYADGEAKIAINNKEMKLEYYKIYS